MAFPDRYTYDPLGEGTRNILRTDHASLDPKYDCLSPVEQFKVEKDAIKKKTKDSLYKNIEIARKKSMLIGLRYSLARSDRLRSATKDKPGTQEDAMVTGLN